MTPTPLWKRLLILLVCVWGGLAAMPNAFYQRAETRFGPTGRPPR